MVKTG